MVHVVCAVADPEGRTAGLVSWLFGFLLNELPFVAFFWLAASTLLAAVQGDLASPIGLTALVSPS